MVARPFLSGFHGYKNRVGPPSPNHVLDFIGCENADAVMDAPAGSWSYDP